jgi:hypothetical protein
MGNICHAIPVCIWGSRSIPLCIWGYQRSPYAYRDCMTHNPRMHTGIKINPVCIRGSRRSPFAYGDHMTLIPVCIQEFVRSPYAYGDILVTNHMHTGNISIWEIKSCIPICVILHTGIAVCIWGSPSVNGQGSLKSLHMEIPVRKMKLCTYGDYHIY